jgi:hypothetical protein
MDNLRNTIPFFQGCSIKYETKKWQTRERYMQDDILWRNQINDKKLACEI